MKIIKKDFPWIVIIEDKIGKSTLKPYTDIAIGFMKKNPNPTSEKDKYLTDWSHTLDEDVLLRGASTFENAYQRLKFERERDKEKQAHKTEPKTVGDILDAMPDDEIPFGA